MLGYVLPDKSELKLREYEIYSGYYCGICKYIGRTFGQFPRMALSYDAAFMALLLSSVDDTPDSPEREHCIVHHIKYKTVVRNPSIEYAGDVMLILAWFKLLDDAGDEGRLYAKATTLLLKHHYKKLREKYPRLCRNIEAHLRQLSDLEKEKCSSIDRVGETFGLLMTDIFCEGISILCSDPEKASRLQKTFTEIAYNMGKWIYMIDAVDDIEENLESGSYNPLLYRFNYRADEESTEDFRKRIDEDLRFNLFSYLATLGEGIDRLDMKKNSGIIENVVYLGLNRKTEDVLHRRSQSRRGLFERRAVNESV